MIRTHAWLWAALLIAAPAALSQETPESPAEPESGVVAVVNGQPIYLEDLELRLNQMHSSMKSPDRGGRAPDLDRLMFRLVNDTLLAQEARSMELQNEPPIPEELAELRRGIALGRLEYEEITARAEPSDEQIRKEFEEDYQKVTLRTITSHELEETEALLKQLREGAEFATLARESSVDQYASRGGLIENLDRIDLPKDLARAAFASEPGDIVGPVQTAVGWAAIRVDSFSDADPERFEKLEPRLRRAGRFRKSETLRVELDERLQEVHPLVVDQEKLDAVGRKRLSDARLMPEVPDPEAIVARVGEETITAEEYGKALMRGWKGVRNEQAAIAAVPVVMARLVRSKRMMAEARRRGYDETPQVDRAVHAKETQLVVARYLKDVVGAGITVEDEESRAYYEEHLSDFAKPPRLHMSQITVAEEAEAERLAGLLREGADMAWLARKHSIDGFKEKGGVRGWEVPARSVDDYQDTLYEAEAGTVVGPLGWPGNYVLSRVDAREDQGHYTYEQAKRRIEAILYKEKYQVKLDTLIQTMRSRSEIEIRRNVMDELQISGSQSKDKGSSSGAPHGH